MYIHATTRSLHCSFAAEAFPLQYATKRVCCKCRILISSVSQTSTKSLLQSHILAVSVQTTYMKLYHFCFKDLVHSSVPKILFNEDLLMCTTQRTKFWIRFLIKIAKVITVVLLRLNSSSISFTFLILNDHNMDFLSLIYPELNNRTWCLLFCNHHNSFVTLNIFHVKEGQRQIMRYISHKRCAG